MKNKNSKGGFTYYVVQEQIEQRKKLSTKEVIEWIEMTAKFIYEVQTEKEHEIMNKFRKGEM